MKHSDGSVTEKYWQLVSDQQGPASPHSPPRHHPHRPYRVELIGVYLRPEVAVVRSLLRRLRTGRAVPIRELLRSHKLFARNFEVRRAGGGPHHHHAMPLMRSDTRHLTADPIDR